MAYSIERLPERISIGRETETGVTDVMIDCGAWIRKWPGMSLHAIYTPDGGAPYILQTETDGGVLVWHVTDADTATPGTGRMEIVGEMAGRRKVSAMVRVSVDPRMSGNVGEPPEAAKPWADRVVEAAERITGMKVQANTLDAGSSATAEWSGEQGLLTIGVPRGDQGPKGEKGEKGPQGEKGEPGKDAVVDTTLTQSGQAADAKVTGDVVSQLKDDMTEKADKAALTRTDRSLGALWKLNQGISYDFQTDAAAAYAKHVPSGAKLASVESVGGKTVAWNQLLKNRTFDNTSNWYKEDAVSLSVDNNVASVNTAIATNGIYQPIDNLKVSHKYYMSVELKSDIENYKVVYGSNSVTEIYISKIITANWCKYCAIKKCAIEKDRLFIYGTTIGTFDIRNPLLIDLTQLFGVGNEPTDISDSRIAWLEAYAAAHPEYNAGELVSADVESVKYNDAIVSAIPAAVRALPGYGWSAGSVANTIERTESGWQYVQRVSSVDMGTLNWFNENAAAPASNVFSAYVPGMSKEGLLKNILFQSGRYTLNYINYSKMNDKEYRGGNGTNKLTICDKDYDSADAFKLSLNGENVNFELSEPIITDITSLMEEPFEVEAGGILIFENAAALPVPNSVEYIISLAEVGV